jgi:ribonuclease J
MANKSSDELVFVPLGGVGEIGMNMAAYGFGPASDRKWIVVDCGVTFGSPDLPGIDLILPDPGFLEEQSDNVLGLILTHSHEDHYGAVLDLWPAIDKPVFATPFTAAMLKAKRASDHITENVNVQPMTPGRPFDLGPFRVEAISVAHSIPESHSLLISTQLGRILHTGDWKLDDDPFSAAITDTERFKRIGQEEGPLALICDSTNALKEGESPGEQDVEPVLEQLIADSPQRVAVTTFASNVGRLITIARAAARNDRQVVLAGRALHRITGIARELGMLDGIAPFLDIDMFNQLPRDKVLLLCTGSQGEPRAAIARIARGDHPAIGLDAGDRVIFSSWSIPGNEKAVLDIQNQLIDQGVDVLTGRDGLVHVSGHPRRGELKQLYDWVKPDVLVPVHGEAAHLVAHAAFGKAQGIKTVIPARNGDLVRLFPNPMQFPGDVPAGRLFLDGDILCTPDESGVKGRRRLMFGGMVVVSLCVNNEGQLKSGPEILIEGVPDLEDDESTVSIVEKAVSGALRSMPAKRRRDTGALSESLRRAVRGELNTYWGRKPNVAIFLHQV